MILRDLRNYIQVRGQAPLKEICANFKLEPEVARNMLRTLSQKGKIRQLPAGTQCGSGCSSCEPETIEIYQWINSN